MSRTRSTLPAILWLCLAAVVPPDPSGASEEGASEEGAREEGASEAQVAPLLDLDPAGLPGVSVHRLGEGARPGGLRQRQPSSGAEAATGEGAGLEIPLGTGDTEQELSIMRQAVTAIRGGGFAVVWHEGDAPTRGVRLQYVDADGTQRFEGGGLELTDGTSDHFLPVVVAHPTSGVFVAFRRLAENGTDLVVQWVDSAGNRRWPGEGVSAFGPPREDRYQAYFQLVPAPGGGVFVCAARDVFDGFDTIRCQRITAAGQPVWATEGVDAGGARGWRVLPQAVPDGAGGVIVVWRNNRDLFDDRVDPCLVEGQRFAADGRKLWGARGRVLRATNLAERNDYLFNELIAVSDGAGGVIVAFNDWNRRQVPTLDVFAQRVAPDGRLLWGNGLAVAAGPIAQQIDGLIAVPGGGAVVSVFESRGATHSALRLYRLGASGGQRWGAAGKLLSDPAATALDFGVFGQADGNRLRTAWVHQQQPGTYTFDIYLAEHRLDGARLSPRAGVPLHTGPLAQFLRGFAFDPANEVGLAVFSDFRPGESDEWDALGALYAP